MTGLQKVCHQILFCIIHRITLMREIQIIIAIVNKAINLERQPLLVDRVMPFQPMFKMEILQSNRAKPMELSRRIQDQEDMHKDQAIWRVKLVIPSLGREILKDNLILEVWTKVAVEVDNLIRNKAA